MTTQETIAQAIRNTQPLIVRSLEGFNEDNRTAQPPGLPNHAAWTLGHLALTMHRAAEKADPSPLPDADFVTGDGSDGDSRRFDTESVCFASTPLDDPARYPSLARCVEIFDAALNRLADAARNAPDQSLARPVQWGPAEIPVADLFTRMIFHNGAHGGQILDLRRALGFEPLIR